MGTYINEYTEESIEDWEDGDGMATWETAFIRGTGLIIEDSFAEESQDYNDDWKNKCLLAEIMFDREVGELG